MADKQRLDGAAAAAESGSEAKRVKTDDENGREDGEDSDREHVLSGFKTSSVLSDSAREKSIFIHGKVALWQS